MALIDEFNIVPDCHGWTTQDSNVNARNNNNIHKGKLEKGKATKEKCY